MLKRIICCKTHDEECKEQGAILGDSALTQVGDNARDNEEFMLGIVSLEYMAVQLCAVNVLNTVDKKFGTKEEYLAWFIASVEEFYEKLKKNPNITRNTANGGEVGIVGPGNDFN